MSKVQAPSSKAHQIAQLVNSYLGPEFPRAGSQGATLNALRVRLETNELTDEKLEKLAWDVREALRTECFKVPFPKPPSSGLLELISMTDILLTGIPAGGQRTFFFPGNRVTVPGDNKGLSRGTTLDLRRKIHGDKPVEEALIHLDGQEGGSFKWVSTAVLSPLQIPSIPEPTGAVGVASTVEVSRGATASAPTPTSALLTTQVPVSVLPPAGSGMNVVNPQGKALSAPAVAAVANPAIVPHVDSVAAAVASASKPAQVTATGLATPAAILAAQQQQLFQQQQLQQQLFLQQQQQQSQAQGETQAQVRAHAQAQAQAQAQVLRQTQQLQLQQQQLQVGKLQVQQPQQQQRPQKQHVLQKQAQHQLLQKHQPLQQQQQQESSPSLQQQQQHYRSKQAVAQPTLLESHRHLQKQTVRSSLQQQKLTQKARKDEQFRMVRSHSQHGQRDILPPNFVPDALRSCSPPPRKRLRKGVDAPISMSSGSIRDAASTLRGQARQMNTSQAPSRQTEAGSAPHRPSGSSVPPLPGFRVPAAATASLPSGAPVAHQGASPNIARTVDAITEKVLVVERLVARRENADAGGVVEYFTKWRDFGWDGCSWESRSALLQDVPGLVVDFDARHPGKPTVVTGVPRVPAAGELESQQRRIADMKARAASAASEAEERRRRDSGPIMIPVWFETPLLELNFADGMVMQFRRDEASVFNDQICANRDQKKRRVRFKQEYPEEARRLFVPTGRGEATQRMDAKTAIEATVQERRSQGSRPIQFPRTLGYSLRRNVAHPIRRADIEGAPPSWESYLLSLGLECSNWERDCVPDMPTASVAVNRSVEHARRAMEADDREIVRERRRRLAEPFPSPLTKSAGTPRIPRIGVYDEDIQGPVPLFSSESDLARLYEAMQRGTHRSAGTGGHTRVEQNEKNAGRVGVEGRLLRARNTMFDKALTSSIAEQTGAERGAARYYDSFFNCWRFTANKAEGQDCKVKDKN